MKSVHKKDVSKNICDSNIKTLNRVINSSFKNFSQCSKYLIMGIISCSHTLLKKPLRNETPCAYNDRLALECVDIIEYLRALQILSRMIGTAAMTVGFKTLISPKLPGMIPGLESVNVAGVEYPTFIPSDKTMIS